MKELSIEQKAKAYDEALEKAKEFKNNPFAGYDGTDLISALFPELIESEDERIRNFLIKQANSVLESITDDDEEVPAWKLALAWLEKQGERKTPQWMIDFLDNYRRKIGCSLNYDEARDVDGKILCIKEWLEKQGEQNLADKVEPKFKVGDIITNGKIIGKVDENENNRYHGWFGYDKDLSVHYADIPDIENWHLWTIQDAKDGDVLCGYSHADYPWIGIFHKLNTEDTFNSYCFLQAGRHGNFCPPSEDNIFGKRNVDNHVSEDVVPATKEQRDTLMKAMADAGYTFDFDKKELKKIEQKNSEWSEEDEEIVKALNEYVKNLDIFFSEIKIGNKDILSKEFREKVQLWLKSLRPQNRWKPSEEMLEALYRATPENTMEKSEDEMLLDKLYQGLKYGRVLSKN